MHENQKADLLFIEYSRCKAGASVDHKVVRELLVDGDPLYIIELLNKKILQEESERHTYGTPDQMLDLVFSKVASQISKRVNIPFHEMYRSVDPVVSFAERLYDCVRDHLRSILNYHCVFGGLPRIGSLLIYPKQMRHCYLADYSLKPAGLDVSVVGRIDDPRGFLEIDKITSLSGPLARSSAKGILTSGHKIVIQSGVLTHIDRRVDESVFGPSVDTLILADIAVMLSARQRAESIAEVGCGNGHIISAVAVSGGHQVRRIVFYDVEKNAVRCTHRNLMNNLNRVQRNNIDVVGIIALLQNAHLVDKFDLVVCNPPYTSRLRGSDALDRRSAVAGEELIGELINNAGKLIGNNGRLLMMLSSTSLSFRELAALEGTFAIEKYYSGPGIRVPFDLEEVLSAPEWLQFLVDEGGLEKEGDRYYHHLRPIVLELKHDAEPHSSI